MSETNPYEARSGEDTLLDTSSNRLGWGCTAALLVMIGILLLLPSIRRGGGDVSHRIKCLNNLKQITIGLHNYHDVYASFPPAYTTDKDGNKLHSWRTLLLPFIDQGKLYDRIDLSLPWDHPKNASVLKVNVPGYQCSATDLNEGMTTYRAIVGDHVGLHPTRGRTLSEFTDELSKCVLIMESGPKDAVYWMNPRDDANGLFLNATKQSGTSHVGGFNIGLADKRVMFMSSSVSASIREAMMTIHGGEDLDSLQ